MRDIVIIGGGPAGSTLGYYLKRYGLSPIIVEKSNFPRYCVGESLLPYNMDVFRDMGFDGKLSKAGFMVKKGAIFGESLGENINRINFTHGLEPEYDHAYHVPRDQFDEMLLNHTKEQGVDVINARVHNVIEKNDRVCGIIINKEDGLKEEIPADLVIDATGRSFFLAKHFNLLERDPYIDSVAVYGLFSGVDITDADPHTMQGDIVILVFKNGWFWFIPFSDGRTSVGVVTDSKFYSQYKGVSLDVFFHEMIHRASGRIESLMRESSNVNRLHLLHNFSYHTKKIAGNGWVLAGDSAKFVDPVYSAGVYVAMEGARKIAQLVKTAVENVKPFNEETFKPYEELLNCGYKIILPFIHHFRNDLFQKILFNPPKGFAKTSQMIITVLSGCFFKPELVEEEHSNFWNYLKMKNIKPFNAN